MDRIPRWLTTVFALTLLVLLVGGKGSIFIVKLPSRPESEAGSPFLLLPQDGPHHPLPSLEMTVQHE